MMSLSASIRALRVAEVDMQYVVESRDILSGKISSHKFDSCIEAVRVMQLQRQQQESDPDTIPCPLALYEIVTIKRALL